MSPPHCLATIFDSHLPSPKLSPKVPPKLSLTHKRGPFFLFQNYPRGEGNCETIERQKLPRGGFCPAASGCREEKSVHDHHRKKIFWGTFLASKKNFPGRWWIQKPYENQENHICHQNLSSVAPILLGKEKFCTGAGRCMLSFSQLKSDFQGTPSK